MIWSNLNFSWQHRDRVAAISQLLYEENLRHSSAGEAAKEERKIADDQDEQLLQENEEINAQIGIWIYFRSTESFFSTRSGQVCNYLKNRICLYFEWALGYCFWLRTRL